MDTKNILFLLIGTLFSVTITLQQNPVETQKSSHLYVFGGVNEQDAHFSSVSHYDSSTGEWSKTTGNPGAINGSCGVVVGSKIYLFGGDVRSGSSSISYVKTAQVFDTETGTYSQFRSMPEERYACAAAVLDDFIYVSGGYGGGENNNAVSTVFRYNLQTTRREKVASMLSKRGSHQLIVFNGQLFAIGGGRDSIVEVYNSTADQWSAVSSTKHEHAFISATVHQGQIYVGSSKGLEAFSPETDHWSTLDSTSLYGRSLVSIDGELWALGGFRNSGNKQVFSYDFSSNNWTAKPDMNIARWFQTAYVITSSDEPKEVKVEDHSVPEKYRSEQLYIFGGEFNDDNFFLRASHYNSSGGVWRQTTSMWEAKSLSCGAVSGTNIYLFGGDETAGNGPDAVQETAEVYDCQTGTYRQFRSMDGPRDRCGAAALDGYVYVAGGNDGLTELSSVFRYNLKTTRREKVSPMKVKRNGHQLVELGGLLYAIGGAGTKTVEAYHPKTDQWSFVANTTYSHYKFGAAILGGKIYVHSSHGFEVYSPEADKWEVLPVADTYRGKALVAMKGMLWALGGGEENSKGTKDVNVFDVSNKKWKMNHSVMLFARTFHTAFVVNH